MAHTQIMGHHPGDSILHLTGTRSKILIALVCIFATGTGGGLSLMFMFFLCHLGMLVSGIFILDGWKHLAALKILFLVLGAAPLFLTPGTPIYFFTEFTLPICMVWISMILGTDNVTRVSC